MAKKTLLSVCLFITLLVISSCVLATDDLGNEMQSSWNQTQDTFGNMGNVIGNVASGIGSGIGNIGNDIMGNNNRETEGITTNENMNNAENTGSNYTAERTATSATANNTGGLNNLAVTWIILGITAAIISARIWYYGTQNRTHHDE